MPNRDTRRLVSLQEDARRHLLEHYNQLVQADINKVAKRRRTGTAKAYKQRVVSDFRGVLRKQQTQKGAEFKSELFTKLNSIIKNPTKTAGLMNTKDRFGYSLNYSLQRVNTRLIQQIGRIFDKKIVDGKLIRDEFYNEATTLIEENKPLQALVTYNVARAYNEARITKIETAGNETITIRLSDNHKIPDICNDLVGTYKINEAPIPPYHLWCNCYVVQANPDDSLRQRDGAIKATDLVTRASRDEAERRVDDLYNTIKNDPDPIKRKAATIEAQKLIKFLEYGEYAHDNTVIENELQKHFPHTVIDFSYMHPDIARKIADQMILLGERYPEPFTKLDYVGTYKTKKIPFYLTDGKFSEFRDPSTVKWSDTQYAHAAGNRRIAFNPSRMADYDDLVADLKKNKADGWLVSDRVEDLFTHEYGHVVDEYMFKNFDPLRHERDRQLTKLRLMKVGGNLSRYALKDEYEAFAESFVALQRNAPVTYSEYTKAQDSYLKDWSRILQGENPIKESVVRDKVYHGSTDQIKEFLDTKISNYDHDAPFSGFWFAGTENEASPAFRNPNFMHEVFLDIRNPVTREEVRKLAKVNKDLNATEFRKMLQSKGYDGVHWGGKSKIDVEALTKTGEVEFRNFQGVKSKLVKNGNYLEYYEYNTVQNGWGLITDYYGLKDFHESEEDVWVAFQAKQINIVKSRPWRGFR